MTELDAQFATLARDLEMLIALLDEADDRFWRPWFERGLTQVRAHRLGGATYIHGCYGGEDTFSDHALRADLATSDPLRHRNLNARLTLLRDRVFDAANAITARRAW